MKFEKILTCLFLTGVLNAYAQTNTFPASGNVGIGTTAPDQKLTVMGGIGFEHNSTDKKLYSSLDGVLEWMTHDGAGQHGFAVSHQAQRRVFLNTSGNSFLNGGNVGIGTTNPQSALQIGDFNSNSVNKQITIPGVYNFETIKLGQIGNGNAALEMVNHNGSNSSYGVRILANIDNGGAGLQFQYAVPKTSYSELEYLNGMMLNVAGNVGIGTINPTSKLQVAGIGNFRYDESNYGYLSINPGNSTTQGYLNWWKPGNVRVAYMGYNDGVSSNNLGLTLEASANFIINGGNVGIGIATPSEKLAVKGKIRAQEIKVETANWPDYVFDQDYKILVLPELDAYIKQHKHLPDMPSAKEAELNGVELGELNKLLLKKVEELTLHLIEKDKELKLQAQKNAGYENRLLELEKKIK